MQNLSFGAALKVVKSGGCITRQGWNNKGMFVFQRPSDTLVSDFIPKVKSLPESVKSFLVKQNRDVEFLAYLCMYSTDGKIINGWLASQADMLSNDWIILD